MSFPDVYPYVNLIVAPGEMGKAPFPIGRPVGLTVHYLADRDIERARRYLVKRNLGYHMMIDRDGNAIQTAYFRRMVNHAGNARWQGLSPNTSHLAVAVASWGKLDQDGDKFLTWAKAEIPPDEVCSRIGNNMKAGFWDAATEEQVKTLETFAAWCVGVGILPIHICGHDECALPAGRKSDPGGVLPWTMKRFREDLTNRALGRERPLAEIVHFPQKNKSEV